MKRRHFTSLSCPRSNNSLPFIESHHGMCLHAVMFFIKARVSCKSPASEGALTSRTTTTTRTSRTRHLAPCGYAAQFPQNGVKRPALSRGAGAAVAPAKAQRRHRGAQSAIASAMRVLCKICGARGKHTGSAAAKPPFLDLHSFSEGGS